MSTTNLTWTPRGRTRSFAVRGWRLTNRLGAGSLEPHPITRSPPRYCSTARTLCWAVLTYFLSPRSRVLLGKLTGSQLVKKFPHFMQPESSLPHSQVPATCPYPDPDHSSPCPPPSHFLKMHLNIFLPSTPVMGYVTHN